MKIHSLKKILWASILILFVSESIDFIWFEKNTFFQTRFDWSQQKTFWKLEKVEIESLSYDFIKIKLPEGIKLNPDYTYKIDDGKNVYYFRYIYTLKKNNITEFHRIWWVTDVPEYEIKTATVTQIKVPLIQAGKNKVMTLGDEWLYFDEGKYFRKFISEMVDVNFIGKHTDLFNFPTETDFKYEIENIVNLSKDIKKADYYIIFFDGHCKQMSTDELEHKLIRVKENLLEKTPKKIFWITFLTNGKTNTLCHNDLNLAINKLSGKDVEIINLNELFATETDLFLIPKKKYLTTKAYREIANIIAHQLNND